MEDGANRDVANVNINLLQTIEKKHYKIAVAFIAAVANVKSATAKNRN